MLEQPAPRSLASTLPATQVTLQLSHERTQRPPQLDRTAQSVAVPERDLARHAGRWRDDHPIRPDLLNPPARGPESDHLADAALVNHLLIELSDPPSRSARLADQEYRVQPAIRDRAAARDRHRPCVAPALHPAGFPVPHDARLQLRELVGGIRPGQHPQNGLECVARERLVRRRPPHRLVQLVGRPGFTDGHGDDLLGQDVERVAGQLRLFDRAFVHPCRDHRGLEEIAAVLGEDDAATRFPDLVPRAADSLEAAGDADRRLDLNDQIHRSHVDAQLEGAGGDDGRQPAGLERLLDLDALLPCERAVVGPNQLLTGQLVELVGQPFGHPPRVAEDDGGVVLSNELQDLGVYRRPDAVASLGTGGRVRARAAGLFPGRRHLAEVAHVLDRHPDRQFEDLVRARVDDRDLAALPCPARPDSTQEPGDRLHGALSRRKPDPLRRPSRQLLQPLQTQRQVGATFGAGQGVDLVHDDVFDASQYLGRLASEDQVERLGRSDEDVGRVSDEMATLLGGRVAGPDPDFDLRDRLAHSFGRHPDPNQGDAQVALHVVDQGLERRDV